MIKFASELSGSWRSFRGFGQLAPFSTTGPSGSRFPGVQSSPPPPTDPRIKTIAKAVAVVPWRRPSVTPPPKERYAPPTPARLPPETMKLLKKYLASPVLEVRMAAKNAQNDYFLALQSTGAKVAELMRSFVWWMKKAGEAFRASLPVYPGVAVPPPTTDEEKKQLETQIETLKAEKAAAEADAKAAADAAAAALAEAEKHFGDEKAALMAEFERKMQEAAAAQQEALQAGAAAQQASAALPTDWKKLAIIGAIGSVGLLVVSKLIDRKWPRMV